MTTPRDSNQMRYPHLQICELIRIEWVTPALWNHHPRTKWRLNAPQAFIEIHTHNQMMILHRRFRRSGGYAELALRLIKT
jgi:hypothetical protein